jgi:hypothetical protein
MAVNKFNELIGPDRYIVKLESVEVWPVESLKDLAYVSVLHIVYETMGVCIMLEVERPRLCKENICVTSQQ